MSDPQSITFEQIDAAQELLDAAELSHWRVTGVNGNETDHRAFYRAERVIPGGRVFSVLHPEARVLVKLAQEADARFATSEPHGVVVVSGNADTHNTGG